MIRRYNQDVVDRNVALFLSKRGIKRQMSSFPETFKICEKGKTRYEYFICFNYDTRDGQIISCGSEIPKECVGDFKYGHIGRAWIEVEKEANTKKQRIRKITKYDRNLRLTTLESEKDRYYVAGIGPGNPNICETKRFALDNLLESILHYNQIQRQKRNQGVKK